MRTSNAARIVVSLAILMVSLGCAGLPPRIDLSVPEPAWISPANQDGVQDSFSVPVSVIPDERLAIDAYRIAVSAADGSTVRAFERSVSGASVLDSLLMDLRLKRRPGVEAPELIVWDGRDESGSFAPDGAYSITLEVRSGKNRISAPPLTVFVDNVAPEARLGAAHLMFSPNADGRKDSVVIEQDAGEEKAWTGTVRDAFGRVVLTRPWGKKPPATFEWNGQDDGGGKVPDGLYEYGLEGVDEAGNRSVAVLANLAVNTASVPFFIATSGRAFSPNGDGARDRLMVQPVLETVSGALSWSLAVLDGAGKEVYAASALPFGPHPWEGRTKAGAEAPDGSYWLRVTVEFENGNAPQRLSDAIALDRTAPLARVAKSAGVFSPDGDGRGDTIRFTVQDANKEAEWVAEILNIDQDYAAVTKAWTGLPGDYEWDGLEDGGTPAPEGRYLFRLSAQDEAGNRFEQRTQPFSLDVRETPAALRLSASGFSPNGDGYKDTMGMDLYLPVRDGVDSWSLRIRAKDGGTVRAIGGRDSFPDVESFQWDGKDDSGAMALDGAYQAVLSLRYVKGNEAQAISSPFALDTLPPRIAVGLEPLPFSPDDDGSNDVLGLRLDLVDQSALSDWEVLIRDREGNLFRRFSGSGSPPSRLEWDGRSDKGELVLSAEDYGVEAVARDAYGNRGLAETSIPVDILVIKEGGRYRIRIPGIYFSPFSAEFPKDRVAGNMATLRRLAEVLAKYPGHAIRIEGHAVRINWADPRLGNAEEKEVLAPLSRARAERIKGILTSLGIDAARLSTAGLGGTAPLVPHSDLDNRWKNRRVDFVLVRR